jgi:hypothetical protein
MAPEILGNIPIAASDANVLTEANLCRTLIYVCVAFLPPPSDYGLSVKVELIKVVRERCSMTGHANLPPLMIPNMWLPKA